MTTDETTNTYKSPKTETTVTQTNQEKIDMLLDNALIELRTFVGYVDGILDALNYSETNKRNAVYERAQDICDGIMTARECNIGKTDEHKNHD